MHSPNYRQPRRGPTFDRLVSLVTSVISARSWPAQGDDTRGTRKQIETKTAVPSNLLRELGALGHRGPPRKLLRDETAVRERSKGSRSMEESRSKLGEVPFAAGLCPPWMAMRP